MMRKISHAARKTFFKLALIVFLAFGITPAVQAQDKGRSGASGVSVSYLGTVDDQPVFRLEFENRNEERLYVSIRDGEGNILYSEVYRDKKFSKRFFFEKDLPENARLTFILSGEKARQSQVFEINTNVRMVQDVVVTRL